MNTKTKTGRRPLLKHRDAAAFLNISERALWTLGNTGRVPRVRIGRSVRYREEDLDAFIRRRTTKRGGRP